MHDLYPDHPEVAARLHADDQLLWDRPGTRVFETSITTLDGKRHDAIYYKATFAHGDGSVAGLIGTIIDITERKQAAQVNARLAAIIENSNDATISCNLDRKVTSWNAAAERMFGYSAAEAIGQTAYALIVPPDREAEVAHNRAELEQGRSLLDLETVRLTKDGRRIDVSLALSPIKDEHGAMTGNSLIFRDIAERKRAEQAARRQIELTQLLEALARAANEAHTPDEALQALLNLICTHGRWSIGHVVTFTPDSHARVPKSSLWQIEDRESFADIIEHSAHFDYAGREGTFLDITINQKKPAWMEDLCTTVPVGPRGAALISKGVRAMFGFPVVVGDEVLALLEFFALEPRPPDTLLLANLTNVGAQLARVIERERALNALREREHLMHLVTEGVPAMIAYFDAELRCRFANTAYCEFRHLDPQGVIGKTLLEITGEDTYRLIRPSVDLVKQGRPVMQRRQERTATGALRNVEIHRVPDMSPEGEFRGYYVMTLDITEQVRAEEVRAQLAAIVENSGDAIWSRAPDGKVLSWNAAATRLFGWTSEEMIGRDVIVLVPPERLDEREMAIARLARGENAVTYETIRLRKDGTPIEVEVKVSAIRNVDGNLASVAVTMNDIGERKRAEQAARRQIELTQLLEALARAANEARTPEEALQALFKLICAHGRWPIGHVVTFAPDSHGRVQKSSLWQLDDRKDFADIIEQAARFDYSTSKGTFLDIIFNQKKPAWIDDLCTVPVGPRGAALISKGVHAAFGFPVVVGDEVLALLEFFAIEPRPPDTLLLANLTNVGAQLARVIERERALNAVREREHLMHLVTEGVPAMIAYFDAELRCRFANAAFCEFHHIDPRSATGKTLLEITGEDTYRVIRPSIDLVKQGKPFTLRRQERTATGEIRHIEIHRMPDMSPEGEFRGYFAMVLDITEAVRAEEIHDQLVAQLREAQKMEAIGTLAGGIAHDFNNILGAIIGNAALARRDVGAGHPALVSLDEIYKASQRAKDLVQQILAFSRKQPQQLLIQPLRPVVEDAVKLLRATLACRCRARGCDFGHPALRACRCDADRAGAVESVHQRLARHGRAGGPHRDWA